VQVLIEEVNVLPNDVKFKCEGHVPNCLNGVNWHALTATDFCGKFQINITNSLSVQNVSNQTVNQKITQLKISAQIRWVLISINFSFYDFCYNF